MPELIDSFFPLLPLYAQNAREKCCMQGPQLSEEQTFPLRPWFKLFRNRAKYFPIQSLCVSLAQPTSLLFLQYCYNSSHYTVIMVYIPKSVLIIWSAFIGQGCTNPDIMMNETRDVYMCIKYCRTKSRAGHLFLSFWCKTIVHLTIYKVISLYIFYFFPSCHSYSPGSLYISKEEEARHCPTCVY
jgi:hypothetical protein